MMGVGNKVVRALLMMAMVVGLLPGMGLNASAESEEESSSFPVGTSWYVGGKINLNGAWFCADDQYPYRAYHSKENQEVTISTVEWLTGTRQYNFVPNGLIPFDRIYDLNEKTETEYQITKIPLTISAQSDETTPIGFMISGGTGVKTDPYKFTLIFPVTSISLDTNSTEVTVGGVPVTLTATIGPDNATDKTVTWSSDNESVATVADGVITAVGAGTATITARATNGTPNIDTDDKTATCTVTVTVAPVNVTGVTLNNVKANLTIGGTEALTATVAPDNATDKTVTWSSDAENVATVAAGVVTAVAAGTATITATATNGTTDTDDDKTATCTVTVNESITEWHVGDQINLGGKYFYCDKQPERAMFGANRSNTVPTPEYKPDYKKWVFNNAVWQFAENKVYPGSLWFDLQEGKTSSEEPVGFKIKTGDGTSISPYIFELVYNTPVTEYPLWVGGTRVTSENASDVFHDGKVSYFDETKTLMLNGYELTGGHASGIKYKEGQGKTLTIVLNGNNIVKGSEYGIETYTENLVIQDGRNGGSIETEGSSKSGIVTVGKVTIKGGTVTARGLYDGIYADKGLSVEGGTVEASATQGAGVTSSQGNCSIGTEVTSFIASGESKAISCLVKNAVTGIGWADTAGTGDGAKIDVVTDMGQSLDYKKVKFPAVEPHRHDGITFEPWDSNSILPVSGNYYLTENVTVSSKTIIQGTLNLCLNGYGILMTGDDSVFQINTGKTLKLYDCNDSAGPHYITLTNWRGTAVSETGSESAVTDGSGVVKVTGGFITGGNAAETGGGAFRVHGTFIMHGGTLLGNFTSVSGGAIWSEGATTIAGNSRVMYNKGSEGDRGGVYISGGTFNISGAPDLTGNSVRDVVLNGADKRIAFIDDEFNPEVRIGVIYCTGNPEEWVITSGAKFSSDEQVRSVFTAPSNERVIIMSEGEAKLVALIPYMAWDEEAKAVREVEGGCINYTEVTSNTTAFEDGKWYVVNKDVTLDNRITVTGAAHLILADGKTMKAEAGITVNGTNSLSIYSQSAGTGKLNAGSTSYYNSAIGGYGNGDNTRGGTVIIHGGEVTAHSYGASGIGGGTGSSATGGNVTIYGGTVSASNGEGFAAGIGGYGANKDTGTLTVAATHMVYSHIKPITDENKGSAAAKAQGTGSAMEIKRNQYMLVVPGTPHVHNFEYSAHGDTITATCTAKDCDLPVVDGKHVATLTIVKPELGTYGGTGSSEATIIDEHNIQGDAAVKYKKGDTILVEAPTLPGSYATEITLGTEGNSTASVGYTIANAELTASVRQNGTLTYTGEAQTPSVATTASGKGQQTVTFTYSKSPDGEYTPTVPSITNVSESGIFYFKASAPYHNDAAGSFAVTMNRAAQTITASDVTVIYGDTDKSISATTNGDGVLSYSIKSGDAVSVDASSGALTIAKAGTATVTVTAAETANCMAAAKDVNVRVNKKDVTVGGITASDKSYDGNTIATLDTSKVTFNGKLDKDTLTVTATGTFADANAGENKTVTISDLSLGGESAQNYQLAAESQQETANATINKATLTEVSLTKYIVKLNSGDVVDVASVTAGNLLVPEDAYTKEIPDHSTEENYTVTVTAKQGSNYAGEVTATFHVVSGASNAFVSEITGGTVYSYTGTAIEPTVSVKDINNQVLRPGQDYIVEYLDIVNAGYGKVKITGSGTYQSRGPQIHIFEIKKVAPEFTAPTERTGLKYNGELQELVNAGTTADGIFKYAVTTDSTAPAEDAYSAVIPSGTDAGNYYVWYKVVGDENHNDSKPASVSVTVEKGNISPAVSLKGWNYGEDANTPSVTGNSGNGSITYSYKVKGTDDSAYSDTAPTNAGDYTVKAVIVDTDNYYGNTATGNFIIAPKAVTITGITASDKTYDATTNATVNTKNVVITGKLNTDDLSVTAEGVFDNADTGVNKTVIIRDLILNGKDKDNYVLAGEGQQETAEATIIKARLSGVSLTKYIVKENSGDAVDVAKVTAGKLLVPADAYTKDIPSHSTEGNYIVTVTANENSNFTGGISATFRVVPGGSNAFVSEITGGTVYSYTGTAIEPTVSVKDINNQVLRPGQDYIVEYLDNVNDGYGKVMVTGLGVYQSRGPQIHIFEITKSDPVVIKAPSGKTLAYNGSAQELVNAGTTEHGTFKYAVTTDSTAPTENAYSEVIPSGTDIGTYYIWYKVIGDENHNDTTPVSVTATISDNVYNVVADNQEWTKGSSNTLTITFKATNDDEDTYTRWKDQTVYVDGAKLDATNYSHKSGSLVIDLKAAYLEKLSEGKHKLSVGFNDIEGLVTATFTIKAKSPSGGGDSTPAKKTDNVVTCQMAGYPANYAWNEAAKACQPGYLDANGVFHSTAKANTVPRTYDKGVGGNIASLLIATIFGIGAAYILRKYR